MQSDKIDHKKRQAIRIRNIVKFQLSPDADIDYKNIALLQRYLNDRWKIIPRRLSGISAKNQRQLVQAVKKARFLALLPSGGVRK